MASLRVSVDRLREGMIIMNDVYAKTGSILVAEGTPVTREVISILTRHFVPEVMAGYEADRGRRLGIQRDAGIQRAGVRQESRLTKEKQFAQFKNRFRVAEDMLSENLREVVCGRKDVNVSFLLDTLNGILEGLNGCSLFEMITKMKNNAESLYTHAVNTALLAQTLAKWGQCTREEMELASVAGLLHDIGILEIMKNSGFSYRGEIEKNDFEQHVIRGYNVLREQNIHPDIKQAVLTHHERLDGTGYPLKVRDANINRLSRIVAVADIYDTLTMNEAGQEKLTVFDALKKMEEDGYCRLDAHFLVTFTQHAAESMIQRSVRLNDGRVGQIVMINKYSVHRPMVRVDGSFIDLSKQKRLFVEEVL